MNYSGNLGPKSSQCWVDWLPPPEEQAAGAGLVGRARLAPDVPNPAEPYRIFEASNRAAAAGAELL